MFVATGAQSFSCLSVRKEVLMGLGQEPCLKHVFTGLFGGPLALLLWLALDHSDLYPLDGRMVVHWVMGLHRARAGGYHRPPRILFLC